MKGIQNRLEVNGRQFEYFALLNIYEVRWILLLSNFVRRGCRRWNCIAYIFYASKSIFLSSKYVNKITYYKRK